MGKNNLYIALPAESMDKVVKEHLLEKYKRNQIIKYLPTTRSHKKTLALFKWKFEVQGKSVEIKIKWQNKIKDKKYRAQNR